MDIGSLFLILALLILVGLFISRPFVERRKAVVNGPADHDRSALLAEKERTLTALKELEFDFVLGKIPEEIYPAQRAALIQRGAEVLNQLDQLGERALPIEAASARPEPIMDGGLPLAVSALAEENHNSKNHPDDPIEAIIAARRRTRQEKAAGFCHKCGVALGQSDQFCPKCGAMVR